MNKSVQDVVITTLNGMGLWPIRGTLPCTYALSEGRLVAQKFFYEEGYAVWVAGRGTVDFYDEDGKLLRTVSLEISSGEKAA